MDTRQQSELIRAAVQNELALATRKRRVYDMCVQITMMPEDDAMNSGAFMTIYNVLEERYQKKWWNRDYLFNENVYIATIGASSLYMLTWLSKMSYGCCSCCFRWRGVTRERMFMLIPYLYVCMYCSLFDNLVHRGSYVYVAPVAAYVAGLIDIRLTGFRIVDAVLSILYFAVCSIAMSHKLPQFMGTTLVYLVTKYMPIPNIFSVTRDSVMVIGRNLAALVLAVFSLFEKYHMDGPHLYLISMFILIQYFIDYERYNTDNRVFWCIRCAGYWFTIHWHLLCIYTVAVFVIGKPLMKWVTENVYDKYL